MNAFRAVRVNTHDEGDALYGERPLKDPVVERLVLRLVGGVAGDAKAGSGTFAARLPGLSDERKELIVGLD